MLFPIGDSPNLPRTPWLTWSLIAVNVAVHLLLWPLAYEAADPRDPEIREYLEVLAAERGAVPRSVSRADLLRFEHGTRPSDLSVADAFTSMFLHAGLMHLAGNMLFLWIFGDNVEHRLGGGWFLAAYLGTGVAAVLGDAVLRWGSGIPSIGASGAISGILGLYFAWFPKNRVRVFVFLFPFFMNVVELPARWVLGLYLVAENLLPLVLSGGSGGVSYGAHVGGFAAGWALAWGLDRAPAAPRSRPRPEPQPMGLADAFRGALAEGRAADAAALLFDLPRARTRGELTAGDKVALGEALAAAGAARAALAAFQRALADHPRGAHRVGAHLGAARLQLAAFGSPTAAYQHLYQAMEEDPTPGEEAAARALLAEIRRRSRSLPRSPRW